LGREIEAELELWGQTFAAVQKLERSKLKPFYLEAALLDPNTVQNPEGSTYGSRELPKIGQGIAEQLLGTLGKKIMKSDAKDAHLTLLGYVLAKAVITIQETDPALKKEVDQERQRLQAEPERIKKLRGTWPDVVSRVELGGDLSVPFKKDFTLFRQEVVKAINRYVDARQDKAKIDALLNTGENRAMLTKYHTFYSQTRPSAPVKVRVSLVFLNEHFTNLNEISVETLPIL
jgi:hypothetical protein